MFVKLKMEFYHHYQRDFVFSTRFGANFFEEVFNWIQRGDFLAPESGGQLGEYDKNFNAWLKIVRTEK